MGGRVCIGFFSHKLGTPFSAAVLVLGLLPFAVVTAVGQSPTVTVDGPTQIADTSAIIAVTINPNGSPKGFYAQWGATNAYGQLGPVNLVPFPNAVTNVSAWMVGLSPNTAYHYQVVATNSAGTGYSADMTLTTASGPPPGPPPEVATGAPQVNSATQANLAGSLNPNSQDTIYYFQWGPTAAYGNTTPSQTLVAGGAIGWFPVSAGLKGLSPSSTYHYRLIATNSSGSVFGTDQSFTTLGVFSVGEHLYTYATNGGAVTIVAYDGPGGDVAIPGTMAGLPVTMIADRAFELAGLTAVTLPDSLAAIGNSAFYGAGITNLTIPDNVTNIADNAFMGCMNLASLHLGNGLLSIGGAAFMGCGGLTRVTIPDSVTNLADGAIHLGGSIGAFFGCGLTNVTIGIGLTYLGTGAFNWCQDLRSVFFHGNAPTTGVSFFGTEDVFHGSENVTVYYLTGATGWSPTLAGVPTALWNPQAQTGCGAFGVQQGHFGFDITGTADIPVVIEASTNPVAGSWIPLHNCTLTNGSIHFADPQLATQPGCFYRLRSP